ncbi:adenylate kinase [Candidatus Woesearchaeota archaeon]|nr:adenylate kinase [Candidatus Woesearchaeota archaeon]
MNLVIIGPPGSGKGTQAERIAEHYQLKHFSTGDTFRAAMASNSELGNQLKIIIDKGGLVPDELVNEVIKDAIEKYEGEGLLFDGYPRTQAQAAFLQSILTVDGVISVSVSDEEVVKRISSRYFCPQCSKAYNTVTLPPKQAGKCDVDGARLQQRGDDKPEAVQQRLVEYHAKTEPIIRFYEKAGVKIHSISGEQPIDDVFEDIKQALG